MVAEAKLPKFKSRFYHLLTVCLWDRYMTSLCFSFFTYKMRIKLSDYFRELLSRSNVLKWMS